MKIELKTLTPLWTGGVETGKMDRVHETGIIGSLRWWYEAIVRGLGGKVCDTTTNGCIYDPDKPEDNSLCDVCRLFGCTGWKRRFLLQIVAEEQLQPWATGKMLNIKPYGRTRGWFLHAGQMGQFTLALHGDAESLSILMALLRFLEQWGSVGAKPQLGYGLFKIVGHSEQITPDRWDLFGDHQEKSDMPNLRRFTFFRVNFEPQGDEWWREVPGIAPLDNGYRDTIKQLLQHRMMPTMPAPHQFFGTPSNKLRRSHIAFSWAYQLPHSSRWQMRGWCYPPLVPPCQQQEVQRRLQDILGKAETCLRALKIRFRSAELALAPSNRFFDSISHEQLLRFLNESSQTKVQV